MGTKYFNIFLRWLGMETVPLWDKLKTKSRKLVTDDNSQRVIKSLIVDQVRHSKWLNVLKLNYLVNGILKTVE